MNEERLQVKCDNDDGRMHIQGVSNKYQQGREYGFAVKVRTTSDVSMWLRQQEPVLKSAASGELMYTPFKVYQYDNNICQIFIPGSPCNHPQGAVLDMHPLSKQVEAILRFAKGAELIEKGEGEPFVSTADGEGKNE